MRRGFRRAVRQHHHAADGGRPGRPRHLCGAVLHHRQRQGRHRRHRRDRKCRQDRARYHAQGSQHHQARAAARQAYRQPDRFVGRQRFRRHRHAALRHQEGRLSGSPHGREQHGGGARRQDRRRHGQCRALQRDCGFRRHRHRSDGFLAVDPMPVFMAATAEMVEKRPMSSSRISRRGSTPPRTSRTSRRRSPT